jgi:molybdopterin-guanine dinucleotide biosynthesis protein A
MGRDKAAIVVGGETLAVRTARVLSSVASPCVEVGAAVSGLPAVREDPPGSGPLVALATGVSALSPGTDALVVACDLPLLSPEALQWLASYPAAGTVVPLREGRAQPLCARWSGADLAAVAGLVADGARSMQALLERSDAVLVTPPSPLAAAFEDVDTPEQLAGIPGLDST